MTPASLRFAVDPDGNAFCEAYRRLARGMLSASTMDARALGIGIPSPQQKRRAVLRLAGTGLHFHRGPFRLLTLSVLLTGCSSTAQSADAGTSNADAGGLYSTLDRALTDSRCPAQWADLTSSGLPDVCTINGLVCAYLQGQAECAPDGPSLKWWQVPLTTGCAELPPTGSCATAGKECGYVNGAPPSDSNSVTNICCDGDTSQWQIEPSSGGCSNGNACGTIQASDYDQTCATDADCTGVTDGDLCGVDGAIDCTNCINATINVSAQTQYEADFGKKLSAPRFCPCPSGPTPVCTNHVCGFAQ